MGGPVPPALASLWRIVGGVSLIDLKTYAHVEFWESSGVFEEPEYCNGVHIDACDDELVESVINDFDDSSKDDEPFLLPIAPDGYHKDNISGGLPYGMALQSNWLAPLENFEWTGMQRPVAAPDGPCDLLSYLRCSLLECAGFPGFYGLSAFVPFRRELLRGVPVF
ncbi:MAG: hypothetical protein H0U13_09560 [Gemmatimonadaceae bacterium]|nr:hypothetical protein [Gemmatimonadaceae bacterium]